MNKYEPFLDFAGCDVNAPSLYLPAHDVSQAERDQIYDELLDIHATELSDEYYRIQAQLIEESKNEAFLVYQYLYGDSRNSEADSDYVDDYDVMLSSRFSAFHARRERRKATLAANTQHIALALQDNNLAIVCSKTLHIASPVTTAIFLAETKLRLHLEAKKILARIRAMRDYISNEDYKYDIKYLKQGYCMTKAEYFKCLYTARRGKSLVKKAKHYDGFSSKECYFFKKKKKSSKSATCNVSATPISRGPKKLWTQEEILSAKIHENVIPSRYHRHNFINRSHIHVIDKSFGENSEKMPRQLKTPPIITVFSPPPFLY